MPNITQLILHAQLNTVKYYIEELTPNDCCALDIENINYVRIENYCIEKIHQWKKS